MVLVLIAPLLSGGVGIVCSLERRNSVLASVVGGRKGIAERWSGGVLVLAAFALLLTGGGDPRVLFYLVVGYSYYVTPRPLLVLSI